METGEAIQGLAEHFSRYKRIDSGIRRSITEYVRGYSRAETFSQTYTTCQGFMLWQV
jgi:hypothetical protein